VQWTHFNDRPERSLRARASCLFGLVMQGRFANFKPADRSRRGRVRSVSTLFSTISRDSSIINGLNPLSHDGQSPVIIALKPFSGRKDSSYDLGQ
jgi:hypothetical protein